MGPFLCEFRIMYVLFQSFCFIPTVRLQSAAAIIVGNTFYKINELMYNDQR